MKTIRLILFVCLLHSLCSGQTYFSNTYKTGYHNYFTTNVLPQSDSSFVAFNYVQDSASGRQDLALLKIDKDGNELFKKEYIFFNFDYLAYIQGSKQFIDATPGSFLATCVTYTNPTSTIVFNKINKNTFDTIKTTYYYDGIYSYYINNIVRINSDKFFLIGNKSNSTTQWPCVFHLDTNLNIVNTFTLANQYNLVCKTAVLNTSNKKILIGATKLVSGSQYEVGFIEIDTLGVISNTLLLTFPSFQLDRVEYSGFDNSYIFNGSVKTGQYGNNSMMRPFLAKVNASNLSVMWNKTYAQSSIFTSLHGLTINNDGSIVTSGSYSDSTSLPLMNYDTKGIILKTNANGDSLWMRQYNNFVTGISPANYQEIFFGVERTLDGGYILCGNVINRPGDRAWIVKTDGNGCVISGCGGIITEVEKQENLSSGEIVVYPNPANDFIMLKTDDNKGEEYNVQITDITGKTLLRQKYFKDKKVSLSEFNSGIFLVNLYIDDHLVSTKKLAVIK